MNKFFHDLTRVELRKLYGLVIVISVINQKMNLSRHIYKIWWLVRTLVYNYKLVSNDVKNGSVALIQQKLSRSDLINNFDLKKLTLPSSKFTIQRKLNLSPNFILWTLIFFFKFYKNPTKLLLAFAIIDFLKIQKSNNLKKLNFNYFIFLNEKQYYEGLFALTVQRCGNRALSICHGFYRDTGKKITISNTNPNNYLNIICPEQVTFGTIQSKIIRKNYHQKLICHSLGKPIKTLDKKQLCTETILKKNLSNILVLDTKELRNKNIEMIHSLQEQLITFEIKKHPDDSFNYKIISVKEVDLGYISRLKIYGCNSTLLLQLGRLGGDMFLYNDSDFLKYIPEKNLEIGKSFSRVIHYDWKDFIYYVGDKYYEELANLLELR